MPTGGIMDCVPNMDEEIVKAYFSDYMFLIYYKVEENYLEVRYANEKFNAMFNKYYSLTSDYFKAFRLLINENIHPDDQQRIGDILNRESTLAELENQKTLTYYYRHKYATDKFMYIRLSLAKVEEENEKPKTLVIGCTEMDDLLRERLENDDRKKKRLAVINALGREYESVFYVDLFTSEVTAIKISGRIEKTFVNSKKIDDFEEAADEYIKRAVHPDDAETMRKVLSKDYISERFIYSGHFTWVYRNEEGNFCEMKCVRDFKDGDPDIAVIGFAVKDEEIRALKAENETKKFRSAILDGIDSDYLRIWTVDASGRLSVYESVGDDKASEGVNFDEYIGEFASENVIKQDTEKFLKSVTLEEIKNSTENGKDYSVIYRSPADEKPFEYMQFCAKRIHKEEGTTFLCLVRNVDEVARKVMLS